MPGTLTIKDTTLDGKCTHTLTLEMLNATVTVRELIRQRVYQEVQDHNRAQPEYFRGLVQPTDAEQTLNGYKLRKRRKIDWEKQFKQAVEAFERNGFLVLVDERQAEGLDETLTLKADTQVSFVKLVPLVGG